LDYHQGFGHVTLANVLPFDQAFDLFLFEATLTEYGTWTQQFVVRASPAADVPFSATLVWTDPPGAENCGYFGDSCLVHDLDLEVRTMQKSMLNNYKNCARGSFLCVRVNVRVRVFGC
jgi:hypothetical protein